MDSFKQSGILTGKLTFFILPRTAPQLFPGAHLKRVGHRFSLLVVIQKGLALKRHVYRLAGYTSCNLVQNRLIWSQNIRCNELLVMRKNIVYLHILDINIWFYETILYIYTHIVYMACVVNLPIWPFPPSKSPPARSAESQVARWRPADLEQWKPTSDMNHESSWLVE